MASYQKRGKRSFLLVVEVGYKANGDRDRRTKTIQVDDDALLRTTKRLEDYLEKELVKFQIEIEAGEYIAPEKRKFHDFVTDWKEKYAKRNYADRTLQNYSEKLDNYIIPFFGNKKLDQIKPIHIVNFLNDLSQPGAGVSGKDLSSSTMYEIDKTLRVVFNKAVEWQVIKESPLKNLKRPRIKKKEMNYYEAEDVVRFILSLYEEQENWRIYFLTAALSGMRRGEVVALEWSNIDFNENEIQLKQSIPFFEKGKPHIKSTKTNEVIRRISMPEWYMEELKKFKLHWMQDKLKVGDLWQGGDNTFLFHRGFGIPYTPNTVNKTWKNIKKRHNLKNIRVHDLRHTMITFLLEDGESIFNVSKRAGHSSSKITTDTYGHFTKKANKSAAERFEKLNPELLVNNSSTSKKMG